MDDSTIKQRIALEGVQEIQKQLKDLGSSGEQASQMMKSALERVQFSKPAEEIKKVGSALQQVGDQLRSFGGQSVAALAPLLGLAGRFGPLGAALAAVTGGLAAIGKTSADAIVEQDRMARGLGLTINQYRALGKAAREVGVDEDTLTHGIGKFVRQADSEAREQHGALVDLTKDLAKSLGGSGVNLKTNFVDTLVKMKDAIRPLLPQIRAVWREAAPPEHTAFQGPDGEVNIFRPSAFGSLLNRSDNSILDSIARRAMNDKKIRDLLDKQGALTPAPTPMAALDQIKERAGPGFANLGMNLLDDKGRQKASFDVLREYAEKISQIGDATERTKRVFDVFGRQSPQFVKLFEGGLKNLPKIMRRMQEQGTIIKPEELERAEQLRKKFVEMDETYARLKRRLGRLGEGPASIIGGFSNDFLTGADFLLGKAANAPELAQNLKTPGETFAAGVDTEGWQQMLANATQGANDAWDSIKQFALGAWDEIQTAAAAVWEKIKGGIASLSDAWDSVTSAAQGAWETIRSSAMAVIDAIKTAWASATAAGGTAGGATAPGGAPFASGGYVSGPGSGTSDSILARVSNGEFVMSARSVSQYGAGFFASLNSRPSFSLGGLVGSLSSALPSFAGGGMALAGASPGHLGTIDMRTDHGTFQVLAPHDTVRALQRVSVDRQISRAGKPPSWRR